MSVPASRAFSCGALPETTRPVSLDDLPALWQAAACDLLVQGPPRFDWGPAFPGRVRGAWGHALRPGASPEADAGQPCPWQPPCALDLLFRDQGYMTPGLPIPKPWVLSHQPVAGDRARVRLTLFGAAGALLPLAAETLTAALRGGIAGGDHCPGRPALVILDRRLTSCLTPPPMPAWSDDGGAALAMRFFSPVILRQGHQNVLPLPSLLTGLGNRIGGLGRWMGVRLELDGRELKSRAQAVAMIDHTLAPVLWNRTSSRQGQAIPMSGFVGDLILSGPLAPLLPLLVLGTQTHCGSHPALGLGGYTLEVTAPGPG